MSIYYFYDTTICLKLVEVLVLFGHTFGETLALTYTLNNFLTLGALVIRRSGHGFPMVKRALRESLSASVGSKIGSETEGFHDWKVSQQGHLWCSGSLLFRKHMTSTTG